MNDNLSEASKPKREDKAPAESHTPTKNVEESPVFREWLDKRREQEAEEAKEAKAAPTPKEQTSSPVDSSWSEIIRAVFVIFLVLAGLITIGPWIQEQLEKPSVFEGTATVQQLRESKGFTRIWMNDGTVWESAESNAVLLANGDEIGYEHNPNWPSLVPDAASQYPNRSTLGVDEGCYLVDKSRPGLGKFFAFRVVGGPNRESCPAGSPKRTEKGVSIGGWPVERWPQERWNSEDEPPRRVSPENGSCPGGYKPVDHLSWKPMYIRHVDCIPLASDLPH